MRWIGDSPSGYNHGMKFSVKNLLALTLLVALTINGCITYIQLTGLQIQNSKLNSRLRTTRHQLVNFESRKLLLERAIEATKRRASEFKTSELAFEKRFQKNGASQ